METGNTPLGNVFKRYVLSLLVFLGMSLNLYASVFTSSDLNGTEYNIAYVDENNQTKLDTFMFNDAGLGNYMSDIVDVDGNLTQDEDGNFSWVLNSDGTLNISWQDSNCSGSEMYTLKQRYFTENNTTVLVSDVNMSETCDGQTKYEFFTNKMFLVNWSNFNDILNAPQSALDAIAEVQNYIPHDDSNGEDNNTIDQPMISESDLLGNWEIYHQDNYSVKFGCASIPSVGIEDVTLANGIDVNNTWHLDTNGSMVISNNGQYLQTAIFDSIENNGGEIYVTCQFANGSSEPRKLVRVDSCTHTDDNTTTSMPATITDVIDTMYSKPEFDFWLSKVDPVLFDNIVNFTPNVNRFAWIGTWIEDNNQTVVETGMNDVFSGDSLVYTQKNFNLSTNEYKEEQETTSLSQTTDGINLVDWNVTVRFSSPIDMANLNNALESKGIHITMDTNDSAQLMFVKHLVDEQCDSVEDDCAKAGDVSAEIMYSESLSNKILDILLKDFNKTDDNSTHTDEMRIEIERIVIDSTTNVIHFEELDENGSVKKYWDDNFTVDANSLNINSDEPFTLKYIQEINASDLNGTLFTSGKAYQFMVRDTWNENGTVVTEYFEVNLLDQTAFEQLAFALTSGTDVKPFEKEVSQTEFNDAVAQDFSSLRGVATYGYWLDGDDNYDNNDTYNQCGEGMYWDYNTSMCMMDGSDNNGTYDDNTTNQCPEGEYFNGTSCVPTYDNNDTYNQCGEGMYWDYNTSTCMMDGSDNNGTYDDKDDNNDWQLNFPYQVVGDLVLPQFTNDVYSVSIEAQPILGYNWYSNQMSNFDVGANHYILGVDSGKYILKVNISQEGKYEGFVYDANSSRWISEQLVEYIAVDEYGNKIPFEEQQEGMYYNHIPNVQAVDTADFNGTGQLGVDFDLASLYASMYSVTGTVTVSGDYDAAEYCMANNYDDVRVCEWDDSNNSGYNNWVGANRISVELNDALTGEHVAFQEIREGAVDNGDGNKTFSFTTMVPYEGNYTIRVNQESYNMGDSNWKSFFFNPTTGSLVDEMNVQWNESNTTDEWGNKYWTPDTATTGTIEVKEVDGNRTANMGDINFISFASKQISLSGTVTFEDADFVQMELINTATGNWFGWQEVKNSGENYSITLPQGEGEYIIRVSKVTTSNDMWNWESYYYDATNGKFIIDNNINWVDGPNGMMMPDKSQTGSLVVTDTDSDGAITQDDIADLNIDFTALDDQFYTLKGSVKVPATFSVGSVEQNGNYYWNNISFEVTDSDGNWIGWYEVSQDGNNSTGYNIYNYSIKLANAGEYLVRVRYEDGTNNIWESYFIDFVNNKLVSERNIQYKEVKVEGQEWSNWVPEFENGLELSDENKSKVYDIDFVALENDTVKLTGSIVVPEDFVPNQNWENFSMIRVEAIDASTGKWLGDAPISTKVNDDGTYSYSIKLDGVELNDNILVKLVKESQTQDGMWSFEAYYVSSDENGVKFISEETVQWVESNITDQWNNTILVPDISQIGVVELNSTNTILDINYTAKVQEYENSKLSIYGDIILPQAVTLGSTSSDRWNSIRVEAIDKKTGEWITSKEVDSNLENSSKFSYELEFNKVGTYIIKVTMQLDGIWEEYFVNFGEDNTPSSNDKLVNGQHIQWIESEEKNQMGYKNWMPNPDQTGFIELAAKTNYNIDISSFENNIEKITGSIKVSDNFIVGEKFDQNGNWNGYANIRVEAISKTTGEYIASTEVSREKNEDGTYPFSLKIGDISTIGSEFILKINKESSVANDWSYQEVYVNFGDNHDFNTEDGLVNGKKVQWVEAQELPSWGGEYKMWMPNPEQTGWIDLSTAYNSEVVNIDLSTLGANDIKLEGSVAFKDDFNLSEESNGARISIIDANTGNWIADESIENNGSFSVNIGEDAGEFIVQINYWHNDYNNWQDSWWKNKVVDFNSDGTINEILNDSDVQWKEKKVESQEWGIWVPDVTPLSVTSTISDLTFDLSATSGGSITGSITGIPSGAQWPYAMIVNPATYSNTWVELKEQDDGNYTFSADELRAADYTVEFGYEKDGKYYHFFIKDDDTNFANGIATVEGNEVSWTDLGNEVWGPSKTDTTYVTVTDGSSTNLPITVSVTTYNSVVVSLKGTVADIYASADINVPGKPFGRWEENTTVYGTTTFTFDDVKDGDSYILNFWYDNNSYTCDGVSCKNLKKNATWIAYDTNDTKVCPKANNDWNCDWDNSYNWTWKPDVTPLTIAGESGVANITATLPQEKTVSGSLSLGTDFANANVYVSVFQHNGSDYNWADFTLDANGEVNSSIKVEDGENYRIELWVDGLGGYVYTNSGWINQNNSWEEDNVTHIWSPKSSTLITIDDNLDLGQVNLTENLSKVTFVLENLDRDYSGDIIEDVWLNLESEENGYYGEGNANWEITPVTYDGNITLRVPNGTDYKVSIFPSNHKGGYASNGDGYYGDQITTATKLSWGESDFVTVNGETTITITLPSKDTLGEINGTVVCGAEDCSGWIDISNNNDGKGTVVSSDGTFEIKGLSTGDYQVTYWADNSNLVLESNVIVEAQTVKTLNITKSDSEVFTSISGTIDDESSYAVLIKTDGTSWEVIATAQLNNGNFEFGEMTQPSSSKTYLVAAAKKTFNADGSSSSKFVDKSDMIDLVSTNNIDISSLDFGTTLTDDSIAITATATE